MKVFQNLRLIYAPAQRFKFATLLVLILISVALPAQAQLILGDDPFGGPRMAPARKKTKIKFESPIGKWSDAVDKVQIQISSPKRIWGKLENPVLFVAVKNGQDKTVSAILNEKAKLLIGKAEYSIRSLSKLDVAVEPGKVKEHAFVIRLDNAQWKAKQPDTEQQELPNFGRLKVLSPKKTHGVQLKLVFASNENPVEISSRPYEIHISDESMAFPSISAKIVSHEGKAIPSARVYTHPGGWANLSLSATEFKASRTYVNFYQENNYGGFSSVSGTQKFVVSGEKGEFEISRTANSRGLMVVADNYAPYFVPFNLYNQMKELKLPKPATVNVKFDIKGDTGNSRFYIVNTDQPNNFSTYSIGQLTKQPIVLSLNFSLTSGKTQEIKGLMPGKYSIRRALYRTGTGRSTTRYGVDVQTFELKEGQTKNIEFVRKSGQIVSGTIYGFEKDEVTYAYVIVQPVTETGVPGTSASTIDWAITNENKFTLPMISPGKYRIIAIGYQKYEREPDKRVAYRQTLISSKMIEIGKEGELKDVRLKMETKADWRTGNGMALDVKVLNSTGTTVSSMPIFKATVGLRNLNIMKTYEARTTSNGIAELSVPPGVQNLITGIRTNQVTFFSVKTPIMGIHEVKLPESPNWSGAKLEFKAEVIEKNGRETISTSIENKSDKPFKFTKNDLQLFHLVRTPTNSFYGVRCFVGQMLTDIPEEIEPNQKYEFELDWETIAKKGTWCRVYSDSNISKLTQLRVEGVSAISLGGKISKDFELTPIEKPK